MKAELILDEDSLKQILTNYMRNKLKDGTGSGNLPFHHENITGVKVVPKIKSIKVFFSYERNETQ